VSSTASATRAAGPGRWLPVLGWLPRYQRSWLVPDVIAALTVWALVVPQAIAYAQIAGLPPETGLFAAAAGLVGYGLLGTSKQLIVTPTSSTAAISASLVAAIALDDVARFGPLSAALAMLVGVVFLILGLAGIGFIARFIPTSVQVGFMFGLGLTIIAGQLTKILGVPATQGTFFAQLQQLLGELGAVNGWTVAIGTTALAGLLIARRVSPALPAALIAVVGGILAVALLDLAAKGVEVIGAVEGGLMLPALPLVTGQELLALIPGAIAISIVGSAESLTVAQRFADEHRDEIRPDQELIANGGANLLAGLFHGFIVAGGASQSAANDSAGARTPLVSFLVAGLVVLTSVALLPLFADLPQAVLGAIVISAVVGFLRVDEMRRILSLRRDGFVLAVVSLLATLVFGILPGLLTSVVLALLFLLVRIARPTVSVLGRTLDGRSWAATTVSATEPIAGLLVLRLDAPMLFLNAGLLRDELRTAMVEAGRPVDVVILDLAMSSELDIESLDILGQLAVHVADAGAELWLAEVRLGVREMLAKAGIDATTGTPRAFRTLAEAITAFEARSKGG
jgi:sulfate permease, SulP family